MRQEQVSLLVFEFAVKLKGEFVITCNDGLLVWVNSRFD
jgi:hypothetical protein